MSHPLNRSRIRIPAVAHCDRRGNHPGPGGLQLLIDIEHLELGRHFCRLVGRGQWGCRIRQRRCC